MKFQDKLAKVRKENNLSQELLADALGVTRQSVSKWESGDSYPDMAKIIQLCKILNCTLNDLMDDDVIEKTSSPVFNEKVEEVKSDNFKKFFDDFFEYIKKSVNMFYHMTNKTRIKMIFELIITGIILYLLVSLFSSLLNGIMWKLTSFLPYKASDIITTIFECVVIVLSVILFLVVLGYIYKIRYLDYYVTLTDKNVTEQKEEKPIEENQSSSLIKDKEPIMVIRDPEHSSNKFFDGLVSFISIIFKCFLIVIGLPIVVGFVCAIGAMVFCIIKNGTILRSFLFICLGVALFALVMILIIYCLIFNRKLTHKLNIILIVLSLISVGSGIGLLTNGVTEIKVVDDTKDTEMCKETRTLSNLDDNDSIYISADFVNFVIDETKDDITLEFELPTYAELEENVFSYDNVNGGKEYYYSIYTDVYSYRALLEDITKNQIHKSYDAHDFFKVTVICNSKNKEKFANRGDIA